MYKLPPGQSKLEFDAIPFEFIPDPNNRWVVLAGLIPWERLELASGYHTHFGSTGNPALPFRVAMGALIIQARLKLSDEETVEQIKENPYLQHFLGFEGYRSERKPFDSSLLVHFRKRLGVEALQAVDRCIYERRRELEASAEEARRKAEEEKTAPDDDPRVSPDDDSSGCAGAQQAAGGTRSVSRRTKKGRRAKAKSGKGRKPVRPKAKAKKRAKATVRAKKAGPVVAVEAPAEGESSPSASASLPVGAVSAEARDTSAPPVPTEETPPEPKGTLIIDATCAESDITYPTDLKLIIASREHLERIIDIVWEALKTAFPGLDMTKPRDYRNKAAKEAAAATRQRKLRGGKLRKALRKQLGYVRRDLAAVEDLLSRRPLGGTPLCERDLQLLETIAEVHRQQKYMLDNGTHSVPERIVSLRQPHVRPIVRGKAGADVEFGAKLLVAVENGHVFVVVLSWENFSEGKHLQEACEQYRERNGHYPEVVCADMAFRTRANLSWCAERRIRLSGPRLGRPPKDGKIRAENKRIEREDSAKRNEVEGKFGVAKRKYGLDRIRGKLSGTSESIIILQFVTMNLWRMLRDFLSFFMESLERVLFVMFWSFDLHDLSTRLMRSRCF